MFRFGPGIAIIGTGPDIRSDYARSAGLAPIMLLYMSLSHIVLLVLCPVELVDHDGVLFVWIGIAGA